MKCEYEAFDGIRPIWEPKTKQHKFHFNFLGWAINTLIVSMLIFIILIGFSMLNNSEKKVPVEKPVNEWWLE